MVADPEWAEQCASGFAATYYQRLHELHDTHTAPDSPHVFPWDDVEEAYHKFVESGRPQAPTEKG
jgi:hypothetical protein